ncbi:MAG: DMT family transporter [Bacteroidales bacterium]
MIKNLNSQPKGLILAFFSTLALSYGYVFSKAALSNTDIIHFGFYWFGFASLWNIILIIKTRKKINIRKIGRKDWLAIAGNTLFEALGSVLFYVAIQRMENPAIVSFIVNLGAIFILLMGFFFLKERFNFFEYAGIFITLAGIFLINITTNTGIKYSFLNGTWLVIASTLFTSLAVIMAKSAVNRVQPVIITSGRIFLIFIISALLLIYNKQSFIVSFAVLKNVALGSFMGSFLSLLSLYYALKYIEASIVSVITSTKSLILIVLTYLFFSQTISGFQLAAGIITITGVILISLGKKIMEYFQNWILKKQTVNNPEK